MLACDVEPVITVITVRADAMVSSHRARQNAGPATFALTGADRSHPFPILMHSSSHACYALAFHFRILIVSRRFS